jgi:hypothetical protein
MDEAAACVPVPIDAKGFNSETQLPYGLTTEHISQATASFLSFLELVNKALRSKELERLESILMPANFSSMVGEFVGAAIPRFCPTLARNRYHNGHPDLIPKGKYAGDRIKLAREGIEVKASQSMSGWQGHNPEDSWLMVLVFESNRPEDKFTEAGPMRFQFKYVVGAKLKKEDWSYSGRSPTSRRTPTASVLKSGKEKMFANWIYKATT